MMHWHFKLLGAYCHITSLRIRSILLALAGDAVCQVSRREFIIMKTN